MADARWRGTRRNPHLEQGMELLHELSGLSAGMEEQRMATGSGRGAPRNPQLEEAMTLLHELGGLKAGIDEPRIAAATDRALARCIDFVVGGVILAVLFFIGGEIAHLTGHMSANPVPFSDSAVAIAGIFAGALFIVAMLYEAGLPAIGLRPPGKHFLHLTVVDESGRRASAGRLALRALLWVVPGLIIETGWGFTFPSFASLPFFLALIALVGSIFGSIVRSNDGRGWHDRIAGTHVIGRR